MDVIHLCDRLAAVLDQARDAESRQYTEKMEKEGKAEEAAEQERKERTILALETMARAFERMADTSALTLQLLRSSGKQQRR